MGGWCNSRGNCADYWSDARVVSERLCGKVEEPTKIFRKGNQNELAKISAVVIPESS
jgi:hypothetical protein